MLPDNLKTLFLDILYYQFGITNFYEHRTTDTDQKTGDSNYDFLIVFDGICGCYEIL